MNLEPKLLVDNSNLKASTVLNSVTLKPVVRQSATAVTSDQRIISLISFCYIFQRSVKLLSKSALLE